MLNAPERERESESERERCSAVPNLSRRYRQRASSASWSQRSAASRALSRCQDLRPTSVSLVAVVREMSKMTDEHRSCGSGGSSSDRSR